MATNRADGAHSDAAARRNGPGFPVMAFTSLIIALPALAGIGITCSQVQRHAGATAG